MPTVCQAWRGFRAFSLTGQVIRAGLAFFAWLFAVSAAHAQALETRSALIVGVSRYASADVPALTGVPHDIASARQMALAMGIPESRTVVLRDDQATKSRIVEELERLSATVKEGGRAFLYFSGHGTRWFEPAVSGCREGLLAYDSQTLTNEEIARHTRRMSEVADKVVVLFDACHSHGVSGALGRTRSAAVALTPKFFLKGGEQSEACSQPVNLRTRSLMDEVTRLGALKETFVQISSARADEVSFDEPGKGGIATQALSRCLLSRASDSDGSGSATMAEVQACAQRIVNEKLKPFPELKPHHITLSGNRNIVPVALVRPPEAPQAVPTPPSTALGSVQAQVASSATVPATADGTTRPPSPIVSAEPPAPPVPAAIDAAAASSPAGATQTESARPMLPPAPPHLAPPVASAPVVAVTPPPAVAAALPDSGAPGAASAKPPATPPGHALASLATLKDIEQQRNPRRRVEVRLDRAVLRIGKDSLKLSVSSSHAGHVYLVMLGSDRKSFYLLFPNGLDEDNRIQAGTSLSLPRPDWMLKAGGPPGENHLLVLVTETPRDLTVLTKSPPTSAAPFTFALTDLPGRAGLLDFLLGRGVMGGSEIFGAQLLAIKEVR